VKPKIRTPVESIVLRTLEVENYVLLSAQMLFIKETAGLVSLSE
jgi:hypothetical protein